MSSRIIYKTDLTDVDWEEMKATLAADNFDNGRTPEQLRTSFHNSHIAIVAYDEARIIGTVRALSDGVCNAYVVDVWTLESYRRFGIARSMMKMLEEVLAGQHVYLFSDDAVEFYEKLGYKKQPTGLSKVVGKWLSNDSLPR